MILLVHQREAFKQRVGGSWKIYREYNERLSMSNTHSRLQTKKAYGITDCGLSEGHDRERNTFKRGSIVPEYYPEYLFTRTVQLLPAATTRAVSERVLVGSPDSELTSVEGTHGEGFQL
jgi:hypothetical protein